MSKKTLDSFMIVYQASSLMLGPFLDQSRYRSKFSRVEILIHSHIHHL